MGTIFDVLHNVKNGNAVFHGVINGIIEDHEDIITGYNKDQLKHGYTFNSEKVNPLYGSLFYALEKNKQNPLAGYGTPDLFLTGAFYRGFFISITGKSFIISSSDKKTESLVDKYGMDIFGLSSGSIAMYIKSDFFPELKKFIESTYKLLLK